MPKIGSGLSYTQDYLTAAVLSGRAYRAYHIDLIGGSSNDNSLFIEVEVNSAAIRVHSREILATSGPVKYTVWSGYSLATDPYLEEVPVRNLNTLPISGVVRPAETKMRKVRNNAVLDPLNNVPVLATDFEKDLITATENVGKNSIGSLSSQSLFSVIGGGSKFLLQIETEDTTNKATQILIKFYVEEILSSMLVGD